MDFMSNGWGICITCIHRSNCLSFQNALRAARPVWHCYEYDHGRIDECPNLSRDMPAALHGVDSTPVAGAERAKGLCINCANRSLCMLPRPAGGVWHCEEYA